MKTNDFYAVVLSGGSGERFWPLSTPERPKQFLSVFGGKSLLRQAVDRLAGVVPKERILVVTAAALVPATRHELPELPRGNVVAEPCRRDTAAAVATACGLVERLGGSEAVCAVLAADHLMTDAAAFRRILRDAARAAKKADAIVTLGVAPTHPATGYGYVQMGEMVETGTATAFRRVKRFVEKPDERTARRYLKAGNYAWNAGMFIWRAAVMKEAFVRHAPAFAILAAAVADRRNRVAEVLERFYPQLEKISIDYAVMEKTSRVLVSCGAFGWDDVGTWSAAERHFVTDARGNAVRGGATLLDACGTTVVAAGAPVAALGVKDLVVVTTPEAVLVVAKDRVQDLKRLLAEMRRRA